MRKFHGRELWGGLRQSIIDAIKELGAMRAESASGPIAELLDCRFDVKWEGEAEDSYPAIGALVTIGEHAIPSIVDAIASRDRSDRFIESAEQTIWRIQGRKTASMVPVFQAALEKYKAKGLVKGSHRLEVVLDSLANALWKDGTPPATAPRARAP